MFEYKAFDPDISRVGNSRPEDMLLCGYLERHFVWIDSSVRMNMQPLIFFLHPIGAGQLNQVFVRRLLDQPFVKDNSKTVAQVLTEAAEKAGGQAKIKRFVRFALG